MKPFGNFKKTSNSNSNLNSVSPKYLLPRFKRAVAFFESDTTNEYDNDILELKNVTIDDFVSEVEKELRNYEEEEDVHIVYVSKFYIEIEAEGETFSYEREIDDEDFFCLEEVLIALGFGIEY